MEFNIKINYNHALNQENRKKDGSIKLLEHIVVLYKLANLFILFFFANFLHTLKKSE